MKFKKTKPTDSNDIVYLCDDNGKEREYKCSKPLLVVKADNTWVQAQWVPAKKMWVDMDMGRYEVDEVVKWCDVTQEQNY